MERCDCCEYEYDGMCTAKGTECDEIFSCNMVTNKAKEHNVGTAEQTGQNKHDNVNHPKHYEGHCSIECIDSMIMTFGAKRTAEYCVQNAYKYVWRHKYKNRLEDLKKAELYLDKFDELVTRCETKFTVDGVVETRYIEIGITLRGMIKTERKEYENGKGNE